MGMPVKLSDHLVLDARVAAGVTNRSITGQIEFWAEIGKAMEERMGFAEVAALKRAQRSVPLSQLIDEVERPQGRARLRAELDALAYPHFEPTKKPGIFVRITEDGHRTEGRFQKREFVPLVSELPHAATA